MRLLFREFESGLCFWFNHTGLKSCNDMIDASQASDISEDDAVPQIEWYGKMGFIVDEKIQIDTNKLFVTYMDSHFIIMMAENEEDVKNLKGVILGHYLSSDQAHEAINTMKTIADLGYGHTLRTKES